MRTRRIRVELQNTNAECGLVCLAMILSSHGCEISSQELRDRLGTGRDGTSALELLRVAREWGLRAEARRVEPADLSTMDTPLILHWNFSHFVVLERFAADRITIVDPASGRRVVSAEEFDRSFTGVALVLTPTPAMPRRKRQTLRALIAFVRTVFPRARAVVALVVLCSVLLVLLGLLPALLTRYLVDELVPGGQPGALTALGLGLIAFVAGQAMTGYARAELLVYLQTRTSRNLSTRFLRRLLDLPYSYFQLRTGGDLLSRFGSSEVIRDLVTAQFLAVLLDGALVLLYLGVLFAGSVPFALVVAGTGVLNLVVLWVFARRAHELTEVQLNRMASTQSYLLETVVGVETIKASGAEDRAYQRWSRMFDRQLRVSMDRQSLDNHLELWLTVLRVGMPLGLLWFGAYLVLGGQLGLGELLAMNTLAGSVFAPLTSLAMTGKSFQTVGVHLGRIQDVLREEPEQPDRDRVISPRISGEIELHQVSFGYGPEAEPAVREVSVHCPAGAKIAIVGRTGSGKSTLARLLLGLHRPSSGTVSFDGIPMGLLDLTALRGQCGVVMQTPHVYSGSILDNLTLKAPDATFDEVVRAATVAEVHEDLMRMPLNYHTVLSEGGAGLSGGQLQRLAIARAVLGEPRILLFDEATSHLDAATEAAVQRNLDELGCTRIVIAHRLSTVRNADLIIVMGEGAITELGSHEELLRSGGPYSTLVESQLI
ncbi:peptidase domain-containing ABC transporter [Crossiella cryophila]|uniref:ABC-type bacteriocin/lantibiotic exporter with double-glycine peptidase domain n=1 Tax=Crossiella cryophila TaxID=43355 RepID=A0A7W7CFJ9_9PSEU|nr:peptidase domain-containing ABC transporter [Crossiella cryophila]MBB4678843.1 ABC-type bacteriocin/lantibiotic exporter with double-glycine peptidase domain [Crossiella cryophila]